MVKLRLAVLVPALVAATPALAEHAADSCANDPRCLARSLAETLTEERTAAGSFDVHRFVDFAPGRVRVYSKSRAKVEALADKWKHHADWSVITVHGFASSESLAQRRADKIRGYLIRYGVPAEFVIAVPHDSKLSTTDLSIELCTDCRK
ncbi:MAG: hypothetical protein HOV81_36985 [Kofleriaceae bacterium]|nr:hypothetical protein [Kofleriaceae bacterium]